MEKIKSFLESEKGKDAIVVLIVIFVGISSFFLGRLSKEGSENSLKVQFTGQEATPMGIYGSQNDQIGLNKDLKDKMTNNVEGNYFASKRGKKYYSIGCSAGKTIKQENRIYFKTSSEAEKAGYTISSSCQ